MQVLLRDLDRLLPVHDLHGGLAADGGQLALQHADARLPGIGGDNFPHRPVGHLQLGVGQPVALELLGQQVVLGDLQFFLVGIAGQLDDLHPVQQGPGDGVQGVGRGDEQHIRQVEGHLQEVVPEGGVLLPVQHLQQGRGRVAPVVVAQLVDLVQQDQGVAAARLADGVDDPAGHGPHIGLPVASDVRLVADAAQRDAGQLAVHGFRHGHGDGRLAHAGGAHQTQHLALQLRGQLLDGHKLQNALLHLVQTIVVPVQGLLHGRHADLFFRGLAPGQLQAHVQIAVEHAGLRTAEGLLGQTAQLLVQLLPHLVGELGLGDLLPVLGDLVAALPLAQLVLDGLHLLPQEIVPLLLGHLLPGLALDLRVQREDVHLPLEQLIQLLQPAHRVQLLQNFLLVGAAHGDVLGDIVGNIARLLAGQQVDDQVGGNFRGQLTVLLEQVIGGPHQGLLPGGGPVRGLLLRDLLHLGL